VQFLQNIADRHRQAFNNMGVFCWHGACSTNVARPNSIGRVSRVYRFLNESQGKETDNMKPILKSMTTLFAAATIGFTLTSPARADDVEKDAKRRANAEYKQAVRTADSQFDSAKARCKDLKANDKDVCQKEAKAAHEKAKVDAKAHRTSNKAQAGAGEEKREADYKVAKEKCDALSGDTKDKCVADAKRRFNQT
jgi:septal ring factor EnvC (AmiA/AmiB activator)